MRSGQKGIEIDLVAAEGRGVRREGAEIPPLGTVLGWGNPIATGEYTFESLGHNPGKVAR